MELIKALLLIIFSLTFWLALSLLVDSRGHRALNRGFALVLASLCVPQLYIYTRLVQPPEGFFLLALAAQATLWLKGPMLWLLVGRILGRPTGPGWPHLIAFPAALAGLILFPQACLNGGLPAWCTRSSI